MTIILNPERNGIFKNATKTRNQIFLLINKYSNLLFLEKKTFKNTKFYNVFGCLEKIKYLI